MKKFILTSAMALIGTFAFAANEITPKKENVERITEEKKFEIVCMPVTLSCTEDCYFYDNTNAPTIGQFFAEMAAQEAYVCG